MWRCIIFILKVLAVLIIVALLVGAYLGILWLADEFDLDYLPDYTASFLGFASSLVMSVLVFAQDRKIANLTLKDYKPKLRLELQGFEFLEIGESMIYDYYTQEKEQQLFWNGYIKYDMELLSPSPTIGFNNGGFKKGIVCIWSVRIINESKSNMDIGDGTVAILNNDNKNSLRYTIKNKEKKIPCRIGAGRDLEVCFVLHGFPQNLDFAKLNLCVPIPIRSDKKKEQILTCYIQEKNAQFTITDGEKVIKINRS